MSVLRLARALIEELDHGVSQRDTPKGCPVGHAGDEPYPGTRGTPGTAKPSSDDEKIAPTSAVSGSVAPDELAVSPADKIDAYLERLAICAASGDLSECQAHDIAREQIGDDLDNLVAQQIAYWRSKLTTLPGPSEPRLSKVVTGCLELLDRHWVPDAVRCGWTEGKLLGLDPNAPRANAANGLLLNLVFTPFRKPVVVTSINSTYATIQTETGSCLREFRRAGRGPLVWRHAAFAQVLN